MPLVDMSSAGPADNSLPEAHSRLAVGRKDLGRTVPAGPLDSLAVGMGTGKAEDRERRVGDKERSRSSRLRSRFVKVGCVLLEAGKGYGLRRRWGY
jgi:hypothetical protein